ncbi:MAG: hypothetical protein ACRYF2_09160 [Janthinobacterium lividum]
MSLIKHVAAGLPETGVSWSGVIVTLCALQRLSQRSKTDRRGHFSLAGGVQ